MSAPFAACPLLWIKCEFSAHSSSLSWRMQAIVNSRGHMRWTIELLKLVYVLGVEHFSVQLTPGRCCESLAFWLVHMWVAHIISGFPHQDV